MSEGVTVALIGLIGTLAGGLITWLVVRRKNEAEFTQTITNTAVGLLKPLKLEIEELRAEIRQLKSRTNRYLSRIVYLMDGIGRLLDQIKELKLEPCWHPDQWDPDSEARVEETT